MNPAATNLQLRPGHLPIPTANVFVHSPSVDGQRFLVTVQPADAEATVSVISNWEKAALGGH